MSASLQYSTYLIMHDHAPTPDHASAWMPSHLYDRILMHHSHAVMHHAVMHTAVTMFTIDQPTSTWPSHFYSRQRIHCTTLCTASYAQSIYRLQFDSSTMIPSCHANAYRPSYSTPCESHIQHSAIDYITILQTIDTFRDDHTYYIRYNLYHKKIRTENPRNYHQWTLHQEEEELLCLCFDNNFGTY